MKWFEEHKELMAGSDDEAPGSSYRAIAKIADEALGGQEMIQFVREGFLSQKAFGEFLGVGESTVAGWMKSEAFPDYAKRATIAAYYSRKYFRLLLEARRDVARPQVLKDGARYMIVQFRIDEAGVSLGEILARDIPDEKQALIFASGQHAWELLGEAASFIDEEIEIRRDYVETDYLEALRDEIRWSRARVLSHDLLLEAKRMERDAIAGLNLDNQASVTGAPVDDGAGEKDGHSE